MKKTVENTRKTIEILREYSGKNPYILAIKREVVTKNNNSALNDLAVEYILTNYDKEPRPINKTISIADWYGEKIKETYSLEFLPQKLFIKVFCGETSSCYHCYVKYRQSMDPISMFISKKAILEDFLLEDFHGLDVDFDRYDRLSLAKDPKRKLKEHQKEAIKFLLARKHCILADEQGLGKTTELSVAAIEGNFDSILIICPASLKTNWRDELLWYVNDRDITIIESYLDKTKSELESYLGYAVGKSGLNLKELQNEAKEKGKWTDNRFVIVNYDILDEFYKIPETRSKENIEKAYNESAILQYLSGKKSLIIIDEAHRLSNMTSDRYKIIKDLIKRSTPDSLYLATGTPITNNPQNFYNLLKLLGEPITDDYNFFMERYCGAIKVPRNEEEKQKRKQISDRFIAEHGKTNWYQLTDSEKETLNDIIDKSCKMMLIYKEATNVDELKKKTAHVYLRRTKEDLNDLPPKRVHEMIYSLNMQQKLEYDKLWDEYETAQLEADPTKEINRELLEGGVYRRYLSNEMVPNTIKLAESFIQNNEKVVIACCYDEELYRLRDYFGDKCVVYNGKMSVKEKDKAKEEFMTNPWKMVFIGNIQSAGVGLTLTTSHVVIYNNMSFVPGDCRQFEDRVHRIGQTHDVDIYYQMFSDTQYEKMWNIVLKKELVIGQIIKKEDEK